MAIKPPAWVIVVQLGLSGGITASKLVVGLGGGIKTSSGKAALASLFLDAEGAVWVKIFLLAFQLWVLDPSQTGC